MKRIKIQCVEPMHRIFIRSFVYFQNRLRGGGHGIAASRMDAKLNAAGWMSESMGGLRLEHGMLL